MIKGIAYVNRGFRYQIHAIDRKHDSFGVIVVDADIEEFDSKVTLFDSGTLVIESPHRKIKYNLKNGTLTCS